MSVVTDWTMYWQTVEKSCILVNEEPGGYPGELRVLYVFEQPASGWCWRWEDDDDHTGYTTRILARTAGLEEATQRWPGWRPAPPRED